MQSYVFSKIDFVLEGILRRIMHNLQYTQEHILIFRLLSLDLGAT